MKTNQEMKTTPLTFIKSKTQRGCRGLTLTEVLVILAILGVLWLLLIPARHGGRAKATRIACVNNLKQVGLAFRIWADQHEIFPMALSRTNGGTMEFAGILMERHFQVMSNELSIPKILICPDDRKHRIATNSFAHLDKSNISYFVGVDATSENPQTLLTGDWNITNGTPIRRGLLMLSTNESAGWTRDVHNKAGNIALTDGSVQQLSSPGLREAIAHTGIITNRLAIP